MTLRLRKTPPKARTPAFTGRPPRVRVGAADPSLTAVSGLAALDVLADRLDVVGALDAAIGPVKDRDRGLTAGQLLVGVAFGQLAGASFWSGLDRLRTDPAAAPASGLLTVTQVPASTTAAGLARRFTDQHVAGIETGLGTVYRRWMTLLPAQTRHDLAGHAPTIDLDTTDVETFGPAKQGMGWNYAGVRCGRVHLASWAGAELPLAADLIPGNEDPRPVAASLLARALAVLPPDVTGRPQVRVDAGYFDKHLAVGADALGCDFAIGAKRNTAAWRAAHAIAEDSWRPARGMKGARVAACDYAPAGWPPGTYTIVRQVRVDADTISRDPRSRRRRTIPTDQLALALEGLADHAWATSFIVTNIPANDRDYVAVEHWYRQRTSIEERFREAKNGLGLEHLPSAAVAANTVWTWTTLIAGATTVMLQALVGATRNHAVVSPLRARAATVTRSLISVPARIVRHARTFTLRLPNGEHDLPRVLTRLQALPAPT